LATGRPGAVVWPAGAGAERAGQGLVILPDRQPGLTRDELSAKVNDSSSLIGMIETGRRVPSRDLAERLDEVFGPDRGTFARLEPRSAAPSAPNASAATPKADQAWPTSLNPSHSGVPSRGTWL
jgi:Helix-turn-helix domain